MRSGLHKRASNWSKSTVADKDQKESNWKGHPLSVRLANPSIIFNHFPSSRLLAHEVGKAGTFFKSKVVNLDVWTWSGRTVSHGITTTKKEGMKKEKAFEKNFVTLPLGAEVSQTSSKFLRVCKNLFATIPWISKVTLKDRCKMFCRSSDKKSTLSKTKELHKVSYCSLEWKCIWGLTRHC